MATHSPQSTSHRYASERGSVLVQVGVALIVLIGFLSFVADYGLMWVARRQAQNAADAGALAGAVALGFDDFVDHDWDGPAKQSAHNVAVANYVAGEEPKVDIDTDVYFFEAGVNEEKFPEECSDGTCIRVDVYRNQDEGNPLPVWFGQLVGLVDQGVRATAVARASFGNASDCLKPWAVVDRWDEIWEGNGPATQPWGPTSHYDKWEKNGNDIELRDDITTPPGPDVYRPPSVEYDGETPLWGTYDPGSGLHPYDFDTNGNVSGYTDHYGMQMKLKAGSQNELDFGAGWFMRLNLTPLQDECGNQGASCYGQYIKGCVGITYKIGDELEIDTAQGNAVGPTVQAVETDEDSLLSQDDDAVWVEDPDGDGPQVGYVANCDNPCPRIVAIPLVDPEGVTSALKQDGRKLVPISNIAGFFVEGVEKVGPDQFVVGRLVTMPGLKTEGASESGAPSTFMRNISLIR